MLAGLAAGVVFTVVLGVISFVKTTTTTLYPSAQDVPSLAAAVPATKWAGAVETARRAVRATVVEQNLPGLSVAVGVDREIVWAEGFGWANFERRVPVAPNTRFRIGHSSVAVTSAAVGLLLEDSRLHLMDDIQMHVPAFPRKEWRVTLRQLMGHLAGIRHYRDEADYTRTEHCERASDGVAAFANDALLFEPETDHQYSTYGWVLVSAAVEAAAKEPFFTFMRTKIFEPLGMAETSADRGNQPLPNQTVAYYPRLSGDPALGPAFAEPADYSCFAGAGGLVSTPSDLVRFGLAMNEATLLKRETVDLLQTRQRLVSGEETDYGLGWMIETVPLAGKSTRMAHHASRTLLGASTSFLTFPERGIVVAVTSNISKASTKAMAMAIADAFAQVP